MIAYLLYFTHQADHSSMNCAVYGLVNIIQAVLQIHLLSPLGCSFIFLTHTHCTHDFQSCITSSHYILSTEGQEPTGAVTTTR